jgi:PAS domain S-box-containing protein
MRFNFFARNEGTFIALALIGGVAIVPFAINNFVQGRILLGSFNAALAAWFLVHGVAVLRGRRLLPPPIVFLPAIAMLAYAMWARGEVGIFWAYPAVLLFHFILGRRAANYFNFTVMVFTTVFAYQSYGPDVALRAGVTLFLTIIFANVFSYVSETQRGREVEQEQLLELERDRLSLLVHATQAGFTDWDTKANVVIYSERFKEMLGYPSDFDTSTWRSFFDLMHPEDHPRVREAFRGLMREKRKPGLQPPGEPLEYRLLRNGGGHVWVKAASLAQVDAAGRIRRFITSFQDISTYRSTADALRDQLKFSADVFDALPMGLAMRDLDGRYVFVNRTWEEYVGAKREDVIGKKVSDRAPREEADAVEAEDKAALARGPDAPVELKDLHYGGKRFMLTRTVLTDASGAPRGVLVGSLDTTERMRMEEALAGEQRRAALLIRAANVGILDWDGVNRTVYYSPRFREMLRYPPDADTSGWPDFFDLVHPEERERVQNIFREHIRGAGPGGPSDIHEMLQYRLRRSDGSYVWVEAFGASVRDSRGYATRFIASLADISERRYQEEALRTAVRLREEVERMSRHDLKTPINSVIAMSRLMRESGGLRREDDELLGSIERAGYRVLNMVNLSLDLFRMEQGSYEFRPRPVDLAGVARRVAADLESQAASKGVRVEVRAPGARTAYAEELLCYSMLANLIKNAIEASPDDTQVTVTVEKADGEALAVHVHNDGAVPEAVRERFFQKYATAGKSGGIGLGSYSARLLARVQQGDISLDTSAAGGTTVTVRLALAAAPAPAAPPESATTPARRQRSNAAPAAPRRVLVVDDDEFNRMVLRRFLPGPQFEVEVAVNGRAAVDAARRNWPDAVLLDLEMPVMDGYEAAKRLRALERENGHKRCTIVAISSNDEDAIIRRALAAGCDHYQVKPAPREILLRLLSGEAPAAAAAPEATDVASGDAVDLDPDLEAALPAFFASRRQALDEMPQALDAGDRARFKRLAHRLAGSFTLYGFRWAAEQCKALERAAAAGEPGELRNGAAAVRAHLDVVKVRVRVRAGEAK